MSNYNNNYDVVVLDDGETWSGTGYVAMFGPKEMREFLAERYWDEEAEEEGRPLLAEMTEDQIDIAFWNELQDGDKAIRDLDNVAVVYEAGTLCKFFRAAQRLGLDRVIWEHTAQ